MLYKIKSCQSQSAALLFIYADGEDAGRPQAANIIAGGARILRDVALEPCTRQPVHILQ